MTANPTHKSVSVPPEPIAVVGIGCRYPGANDVQAFWELLRTGRDAIRDIPDDRFDVKPFYDPRPNVRGKTVARKGGFVDHAFDFDAEYFRISPREAARLDPQQRLMLEICADAIDDGNLTDADLAGQPVGVYIGCWSSDWEALEHGDRDQTDVYSMAGTGRCLISGRVSFAFDLRGPSLTVDTGCSASLIAVSLACQSLWAGESSMAICGGVNLVLDPKQSISFSQAGMMAADGHCKAYDQRADGFVRSDGCGAVVLMPLSRARARGARVYAVIRGVGCSNDGFSNGLLATPSEIGQERAVRAAYTQAGLPPLSVQYVEGHGTGTRAGDPVELRTLARVLRERDDSTPCLVGSVKSNIGHTEGAAGVAGLIKAVLAVHHRTIPKSLHCETPTDALPWDETPLRVATEATPFPEGVARAAVSSFGISGTNVHIVVEQADTSAPIARETPARLLLLSARSEAALRASAARYKQLLERAPDAEDAERALSDLCYSAALGRRQHDLRLALVGRGREHFAGMLGNYLEGEPDPGMALERAQDAQPELVFVFSGQGSQWEGMARELCATEPVFAEAILACDRAMRDHASFSLLEELGRDRGGAPTPIDIIQPSIFAFQVALSALLRSLGVVPNLVVGHSMGEVAAAHVAGILDLADAARIICHRSRVLENLRGQGGMLSVELGFEEAEAAIAGHAGVSIAASNGRETTILSGDLDGLRAVEQALGARGVVCREVQVDAAAHSPQLDPQMPELGRALASVSPHRRAPIAMCSTVTAEVIDPTSLGADYWVRNMRQPVRFARAIEHLLEHGHNRFVEIGPHPNLVGPMQQLIGARGTAKALPTITRNRPERESLLLALGRLHGLGHHIDFRPLFPQDAKLVPLPGYPWQRDRYDQLPGRGLSRAASVIGEAASLGRPVVSPAQPDTFLWNTTLSVADSGYLRDHRVQNAVALPGAAFANMALQAGQAVFGQTPFAVEDLRLDAALLLPEDTPVVLQVSVTPGEAGVRQLKFSTELGQGAGHVTHASASLRALSAPASAPAPLDPAAFLERGEPRALSDHFAAAAARGIEYGPAFRGLQELRLDEQEGVARVALPSDVPCPDGAFAIHPALLDACFQAYASVVFAYPPLSALYVPVSIGAIHAYGEVGSEVLVRTVPRTPPDSPEVRADVHVFDPSGAPLLSVTDLCVRRVGSLQKRQEDAVLALTWQARPRPEAPALDLSGQTWLVLMDPSGRVGDTLVGMLEARGARCERAPLAGHGNGSALPTRVDPGSIEQVKALIARAAGHADRPLAGVIDLWGLAPEPDTGLAEAALLDAQRRGVVGLTHVMRALAEHAGVRPTVWALSAGAQPVVPGQAIACGQAPIWALARVLRYEFPEIGLRTIDVSADVPAAELEAFVQELACRDIAGLDELALRGDARYLLRLVPAPLRADGSESEDADGESAPTPADAPFQLTTRATGSLDNLVLRAVDRPAPGPGEVEIEVVAGGLNFIDVMKAFGIYPGMEGEAIQFGGECAGRVSRVGEGVSGVTVGQRVLAMASGANGCLRRYVVTRESLVAPLPEKLDFAQGATIPAVFLTSHYALHHVGRLARGERVLIHSATGGVGLSAIQMAQRAGAEIFATAGSPEKRQYLHELGIEHVFDSRSTEFAAQIRARTGGEGVDVVLNSLTGEALRESLSLLRDDGRFLEIGKRDIYEGMQLGMLPFKRGLSFTHIDLARLARDRDTLLGGMLQQIVADLQSGALSPLPVTRFPICEASEAFSFMAQAKHIGKVVLELDHKSLHGRVLPAQRLSLGEPAGTYVLSGGLGGLGLLVARMLSERGARHLVLLGRSAPKPEAETAIEQLRGAGVEVAVHACDIADGPQVAAVLAKVKADMPPIRGVFHAAAVLDDGVALQMTPERFHNAMAPKMLGALHLHTHTLDQPLDHFVLFSSAAAVIGSPGQSNYAAGNEFLDALAHQRRHDGRPALTINWGTWRESGIATGELRAGRLSMRGVGSLSNAEGLAILERLMLGGRTQAVVVPDADFHRWSEYYPSAARTGLLEEMLKGKPVGGGRRAGDCDKAAEILAAEPAERADLLEQHLTQVVRHVLRMPSSKELDPQAPLNRFGIDSLMAVELKNRIEADLGVALPVSKLLLSTGLRALSAELLSELETDGAPAPRPAEAPTPVADASEDAASSLDDLLAEAEDEAPWSGSLSELTVSAGPAE